jgi:hypothetical protein
MHLKRLLNTALGKVFISILLGLGLATLFRKVCNDRNCLVFNGPVIGNVDGKIYKHGEKCYQYKASSAKCDTSKQIVDMSVDETNVNKAGNPLFQQLQQTQTPQTQTQTQQKGLF